MQTREKETTGVAAPGPREAAGRPRGRRLVAVVVGLTALVAAAVGVVAADDDGKDAPSETPTTQVIPFVTTPPSGPDGSSADG